MPLSREPSPRYKLKKLSKQLRKLSFPTSPVSVTLATFAADAFDQFLAGKSRTLDAAFGLQKKRGVPGWPEGTTPISEGRLCVTEGRPFLEKRVGRIVEAGTWRDGPQHSQANLRRI
jgi:hypothetical protein